MPPSRKFSELNLSDSMRHLKAGLQVLGRPRVLGSVFILLLAGYGLFQYWGGSGQNANATNPARRNPLLGSESNVSSPDFGVSNLGNLPGVPGGLPQYAAPGSTSTSSKVPGSPTRPSASPFITNPVTVNSPSSGDVLNLGGTSGTSAGSANSGSVESGVIRSVSPLQAGLDRNLSPGQGLASSEPNGSSPGSSATGSLTGGSLAGSNSTETMRSPVGASQFQPYVPRTSPPSGSTGYTLPPAFRTPANSSDSMGFSNFSRTQPLPGFTSAQPRQSVGSQSIGSQSIGSQSTGSQTPQYQTPQYQVPQNQTPSDPFSVPRTTPGRSIGGGQINTFSNP